MIDAFEVVHTAGRTYNDLKPQNIMVETDDSGEPQIVLIDFGFAAKYTTPEGLHITDLELKDSF